LKSFLFFFYNFIIFNTITLTGGLITEQINENVEVSVRMPRIGEPAPQFEAVTTFGKLKLEDFKGSWLVLFSHPADFTPVCTTEFIAFAQIHHKLREMNC